MKLTLSLSFFALLTASLSCTNNEAISPNKKLSAYSLNQENLNASGSYYSETTQKQTIDSCTFALDDSSYLIATPIASDPIAHRVCGDGLDYSSSFQKISFAINNSLSSDFDSFDQIDAVAIKGTLIDWDLNSPYILSLRKDGNEWFITGLSHASSGSERYDVRACEDGQNSIPNILV